MTKFSDFGLAEPIQAVGGLGQFAIDNFAVSHGRLPYAGPRMVAGTTINVPIGRHPNDRIKQAVVKEGQGRDDLAVAAKRRFRRGARFPDRITAGA